MVFVGEGRGEEGVVGVWKGFGYRGFESLILDSISFARPIAW